MIKFPDNRHRDLRSALELRIGVHPTGGNFCHTDALPKIPCGTFVTVKRCLFLFLEILQAQAADDGPWSRAVTAQADVWRDAATSTQGARSRAGTRPGARPGALFVLVVKRANCLQLLYNWFALVLQIDCSLMRKRFAVVPEM